MKLLEGNLAAIPDHIHVEQDGSYFFVLTAPRMDFGAEDFRIEPALAVLDAEVPNCELAFIDGDDHPANQARNIARAYFEALGVNATFDE